MYVDTGGECIEIQGIKCYLPKQPQFKLVAGYHLPKEQQKWYPTPLPSFKAKEIKIFSNEKYDPEQRLTWEQCEREEIIGISGHDPWIMDKQKEMKQVTTVDPDTNYRSEPLEKFRNQQLDRIENGYWFMLNGKATYLTGIAYMYFNWWQMDIGLPNYRDYIRKLAYVVDVVKEDPRKIGLILASMRGVGKSYFATCAQYTIHILKRFARSGMQSKSDDDAEILFQEKLCEPVSKLPSFLVPIHSWGIEVPKKKLEFFPPRKIHPNFKYDKWIRTRALRSTIDFKNAKDNAYDSTTQTVLLEDEIGKIKKEVGSVKERFRISRFCVYRGSIKRGILFGFTTVGEMEKGGGDEFKELFYDSDQTNPQKLTADGWTLTGCVKYFISALEATVFDEFGISDYSAAKKLHDDQREALRKKGLKEGDMSDFISYCQNNPYTEAEAFMFHGKGCIFNAEILQTVQFNLSNPEIEYVRKGILDWDKKDERVKFYDDKINGPWEFSKFPDEKIWLSNDVGINIGYTGKTFAPKYRKYGRASLDPISHKELVVKSKGSDAAITGRSLFIYGWPEEFCNVPIAHYRHRPSDPEESFEQAIMLCFLYSIPILIENQKYAAITYFERRGYGQFLMRRPESTFTTKGKSQGTLGIPSSPSMIDYYVTLGKTDVNRNGLNFKHLDIVQDLLEFDPQHTTEFDSGVSYMLSLVASEEQAVEEQQSVDISKFYTQFNHNKR
jgi:hypothetical protein